MLCWHYPFTVDTYQNDFKCFTINVYETEIINEIILNYHKWLLLMEMHSSVSYLKKH